MEELYLLVIGLGVYTEVIALVGVNGSTSSKCLVILHEGDIRKLT